MKNNKNIVVVDVGCLSPKKVEEIIESIRRVIRNKKQKPKFEVNILE